MKPSLVSQAKGTLVTVAFVELGSHLGTRAHMPASLFVVCVTDDCAKYLPRSVPGSPKHGICYRIIIITLIAINNM